MGYEKAPAHVHYHFPEQPGRGRPSAGKNGGTYALDGHRGNAIHFTAYYSIFCAFLLLISVQLIRFHFFSCLGLNPNFSDRMIRLTHFRTPPPHHCLTTGLVQQPTYGRTATFWMGFGVIRLHFFPGHMVGLRLYWSLDKGGVFEFFLKKNENNLLLNAPTSLSIWNCKL